MTVIRTDSICVSLGGVPVLKNVSCSFEQGWTAIVGPNGAGKSTLLRVIAGLLPPADGRVLIDNKPLHTLKARERGQKIAWLAQQNTVTGALTARETVQLGRLPSLGLFGVAQQADNDAVNQAMTDMACHNWQDRRLSELSGGERQRVLLARALATQAPVLALDEPTTHLDPPHQMAIANLCRRLGRQQTVISVMHDLSLALLADRVLIIADGQVHMSGRYDEPELHAALEQVFERAIKIDTLGRRPIVIPRLESLDDN